MTYFVKIILITMIIRYNVESKAINKGLNLRKSFQFELIPFKHFSFFIENLTPFGKFEMKHSLEKRDTNEEPPIANEIPVTIEEKKETVVITSGIAPAVEAPIPQPASKADIIPFVIQLAPKPVEVPLGPPPPVPPVVLKGTPPISPIQATNIPVFYTDISQIPLFNFALSKPVPVKVPIEPVQIEEPIKSIQTVSEVLVPPVTVPAAPVPAVLVPVVPEPDVPVPAVPVQEVLEPKILVPEVSVPPISVPPIPVPPIPVPEISVPVVPATEVPVPVIPVEPVPVAAVPVQPEPAVQIPVQPIPVADEPLQPISVVQEVVVNPAPVIPTNILPPPPPSPTVTPAIVPPQLPNYLIKGSRLIIFFGSKILQMLTQFIDGRSFNEFTLPPLPPFPPLGKKK